MKLDEGGERMFSRGIGQFGWLPHAVVVAAVCAAFAISGCKGPKGDTGPAGPGEVATYVGPDSCGTCHGSVLTSFLTTGHPYKLNKMSNGILPTYP
ncbi:MAG: hypothetical protein ACE5JA_08065, partial [bacterium]